MARFLPAVVTCAALIFPLLSQTNAPQEPAQPVIRTTTREVVLDLVVRDKHEHAVTDLHPNEVQVFEDGVRQDVREFRNVRGTEQLETERTAVKSATGDSVEVPKALNSLRQLNFVSVVFADIAPLNLEFARRSVQEFLKSDTLPNTYVTVYRLNRQLAVIQPYTSDKDVLAKAVEKAAKGLTAQSTAGGLTDVISSEVQNFQAQAELIMASPGTGQATTQAVENELNNPLAAISKDPMFAANSASEDASFTLGNAILAQSELAKGLRFSQSSAGMEAMDSLRALVRSQEKLPGRKVVLYLADGLNFPANRREIVDGLISYANRSGVSFYTIDTRGLNVNDPMMSSLAAQRRAGTESTLATVDPKTAHFEDDDVQLAAVGNTQLAMRELAESTGGFAVTDTNEIGAPMQRMMEDIRTHYELAYSPTSTTYDGHFRKIEVRVTRPKLTVQTRKGYYAVPDLNGEPLQPYELLALNALNEHPAGPVFPYEFAAMKFRPQARAVEYEVTFEIPLAGLKAVTEAKTGLAHYQAGLVAFVHDATGQVVTKVSRELARDIAKEAGADLANTRILYAEPIELPPGHYVVDAAVTDEPSGKTSVKRVSLFVDQGKDLSLSSLELVRRFEPLTAPRNPGSPFELENGRITPTLTGATAAGTPMSVYFVVYPGKPAGAETPNVTVEVIRDGKEIARKPLNLATPDFDGSIPMLVQLSPGPGQCDVLVTAKQGTAVAQSSLSVRVE